jgi:hypothetical protein
MLIGAVLTAAFLLTVLLVGEQPRMQGLRHSSPTWDDLYHFDFRAHRRFAWLVLSRGLFLIGLFAVTRFLLLFLVGRFGIDAARAGEQSGMLLGTLILVTVLAAPLADWLSDRLGHGFIMGAGALLAASGLAVMAFSGAMVYVLAGTLLLAVGSGAFLAANTSLADDLIPAVHATKFKGLASIVGLGAAAVAGLFGPLLDWSARIGNGKGDAVLFAALTPDVQGWPRLEAASIADQRERRPKIRMTVAVVCEEGALRCAQRARFCRPFNERSIKPLHELRG